MNAAERVLLRRYLWPGRGGGAIVLVALIGCLGVAIGVAALVLVVSVMNAAETRLAVQVGRSDGHVWVARAGHDLDDWGRLRTIALRQREVLAATPTLSLAAAATVSGRTMAAELQGLTPDALRAAMEPRAAASTIGVPPYRAGEVAIGQDLARRLGVLPGDLLALTTIRLARGGEIEVRDTPARVTAVLDSGNASVDATRIVMPLDTLRIAVARPGAVSRLVVSLCDPDAAPEVARRLRHLAPGASVTTTWEGRNAALLNATLQEKVAMTTIVSIVTLVALANIASSLLMLVQFKRREIAVLLTMGMGGTGIVRVFVAIGATLGTVGGSLGLTAALLLIAGKDALVQGIARWVPPSPALQVLLDLPLTISPWEIARIVSTLASGVIVSTAYPSWRAAGVSPVAGLAQT